VRQKSLIWGLPNEICFSWNKTQSKNSDHLRLWDTEIAGGEGLHAHRFLADELLVMHVQLNTFVPVLMYRWYNTFQIYPNDQYQSHNDWRICHQKEIAKMDLTCHRPKIEVWMGQCKVTRKMKMNTQLVFPYNWGNGCDFTNGEKENIAGNWDFNRVIINYDTCADAKISESCPIIYLHDIIMRNAGNNLIFVSEIS
jgi:hypothetical protein